MEARSRLFFSVFLLLLTISHVSNSVGNGGETERSCPESVVESCTAKGREPCSGRDGYCGNCINPEFELQNDICTPLGDEEDLPGEAIDRIVETLTERKGNHDPQGEGGTSASVEMEPLQSKEQFEVEEPLNLLKKSSEAEAQFEERSEETHAVLSGEIVLEEWQFMCIVGGCILFAVIGVAISFYCCYRIQTAAKDSEVEYPSYGVTGPGAALNGDRKLAQSAQMYHYQHQKQQMVAMQKREKGESAEDASDYDSEEENEDGDLTVYECPGLAPTGEMQVKNPLFSEEQYNEETTPQSPPPAAVKESEDEEKQ